jgi:integrase
MSRRNRGVYIEPRENGIFYLHWTETVDHGGRKESRSRRRSTGTADRKEAERVLAGFILEKDTPPNGEDALIVFLLEDYYKEHVSYKPSRDVADLAIKHLTKHAESHPISLINRRWCEDYAVKRRRGEIGKGATDGTIRRELGVLVAAMNHAAREKKIKKSDVPHVFLPEEPPPRDVWLTQDEAQKLRNACVTSRTRLFVEVGLATGARRRAIESLTWFQVDLERRLIQFNPDGRKQTKKRRPTVPISDALMPWLVEAHKTKTSEWVLGESGSVRKGFEASVRRAGLKKRVTPHTLRHTLATWMAQAGKSFFEIAGVLGDIVSTVEKRYAHHNPHYLRDAVNFMGVKNEKDSASN